MPILASQLSLVLSGGSGNNDPTQSLGGSPSAIPIITDQMDNLFSDVAPSDTQTGITDYRCMYIFNDGADTVYNVQVWITNQIVGSSVAYLGIAQQDEVQRIIIIGAVPTGATITFAFMGYTFTSASDPNVTVWAENIQLLMNGLINNQGQPLLSGVQVIGQVSGTTSYFDVTFGGLDGGRDQSLISVSNSSLILLSNIGVQLLVQGGPVNTIAPLIDVSTTPPTGVAFSIPTVTSPILILKLGSGEGFPIWAQRVTPAGAASLSQDGFTMNALFQSLP